VRRETSIRRLGFSSRGEEEEDNDEGELRRGTKNEEE
jgi:hypothetical protein